MNEKNMEQKILQDRCHHPSVDQQILDYVVPYLFWLESTAVFQADSSRSVHCCRKFSFYCFFCWLPFIFISLKVSHQKLERKWPVSQPKPKQTFLKPKKLGCLYSQLWNLILLFYVTYVSLLLRKRTDTYIIHICESV